MRKNLLIVFCLVTINLLADGGDHPVRLEINCFEPNLNIQYVGVKDTIHYLDKKKTYNAFVTSNIAIYDVVNNKTNYLFKDTLKRQIIGFYFESKYIEEYKTIEFNNSFDPADVNKSGLYEHSNNRNVSSRSLSENLIIISEDVLTGNLTFWICDKYGNDLKKGIEISKDWNWEIDVKNRSIRFTKQVNHKIEIQNLKY